MTDSRYNAAGKLPNGRVLSHGLVLIMSAATGIAVGSQYYNQPLLGMIADDFGTASGLVATTTQIGYALGLILLVPLGDKMERRTLILFQCLGLALAMVAASLSPGLYSLAFSSVLIGMFATIAQQMIPHAAGLTSSPQRERALATITSGLLVGVLVARTVGGFVGAWYGWRSVFLLGAVLSVLMMACLAVKLPRSQSDSRLPYLKLLSSLFVLARSEPVLRKAALTQSLLFFGFSAFWTILALLLQTPRFGLNSGIAGLFGIVALAGAALAPFCGRIAGKRGPQGAVRLGVILVVASFLLMIPLQNLIGLGIGVILMTTGLQISLISHQTIVLAAAGSARGRFNTVFMAAQFAFGAAGSAAASVAWEHGGWTAVMIMSAAFSLLAMCLQSIRIPKH
ncbi:putative MFS family arabinose efflux permease [Gibbsiella quercinecans]|uniref:Permease n=1 Tax=Gibbsiella quercinecans TaxID=929813 RepID=A0A250AWP2_9GAMM|nr:MFS transporter [Gibbsiella quercinecans]ATA18347.1 permease [Gibbsiella quercinecans]RLM13070.1 permease [Gibbsiella quercinecans]RLM14444.1 permease [Gibbsiella quercinecans]TCT90935.1 putative MFS family arabinose efflux permease [Gibbsiella quercinecans]